MAKTITQNILTDLAVGRNVTAGGDLRVRGGATVGHDLEVQGWLRARNIAGPCRGLYKDRDSLEAANPHPRAGWWALVETSLEQGADGRWAWAAAVYRAEKGVWVDSGGTYTAINAENADFSDMRRLVARLRALVDGVGLVDVVGASYTAGETAGALRFDVYRTDASGESVKESHELALPAVSGAAAGLMLPSHEQRIEAATATADAATAVAEAAQAAAEAAEAAAGKAARTAALVERIGAIDGSSMAFKAISATGGRLGFNACRTDASGATVTEAMGVEIPYASNTGGGLMSPLHAALLMSAVTTAGEARDAATAAQDAADKARRAADAARQVADDAQPKLTASGFSVVQRITGTESMDTPPTGGIQTVAYSKREGRFYLRVVMSGRTTFYKWWSGMEEWCDPTPGTPQSQPLSTKLYIDVLGRAYVGRDGQLSELVAGTAETGIPIE